MIPLTLRSLVLLAPLVVLAPASAVADVTQCRVVDVKLQPATSDLQIVAWIEDAAGHYVDTIFLTQAIGSFGLGNRPGRFDLNSGPPPPFQDMWPYGRRTTTFPVWSHHHGLSFPQVVYQHGPEDDMSHAFEDSTRENHFCSPRTTGDPGWDIGTCASAVFTDKGTFSSTLTTGYPPRRDVIREAGKDSPSVDMYKAMNPFDAVSQATPIGGVIAQLHWTVPPAVPAGDYTLWVEVARGFDFNATYNSTSYPPPSGIRFASYGQPYRGQPSIIYKVPFVVAASGTTAETLDYAGYGDPNGMMPDPHLPDSTITTDTPASGASRLQILSEGTMYRVHLDAHPDPDMTPPADPRGVQTLAVTSTGATVSFIAPGNDGLVGKVTGYEIRIRANTELTADNFADAMPISTTVIPVASGGVQTFELAGLLPLTDYYVGIRAFDGCRNASAIAVAKLTTLDRKAGDVNACFIATAAYGSIMANDVEMLRHFRDAMMRSTVVGELAIETYYTFGPAVAGVVGESELLRASVRDILGPIVSWVRNLTF